MDKQQIMSEHKGYWRQIENVYRGMVKRYRGNPEWMAWAKAQRLEKLRAVCQKVKD